MATAAALALLAYLFWAPSAPAATFGANLNRPADSPFTCSHTSIFPVPSCTVNSTNLATGESPFPPVGEGIVSAVRVRVGPVTGPMQVVVEQAVRKDNPLEPGRPTYACCSVVAMSQVFTPAPNAVSQIPVSLRLRQDISPDANGHYVDQHLGLSVLAPNVPIPASLDSSGANSMGVWWPAWQGVGELRVGPSGSLVNPVVLMSADWDPVGVPPAAAPPAVPTAVRAISIPSRQALVQNARARVLLACGLDVACAGRVLLQNRSGSAAGRALIATASARPAKGKKGAAKGGKGKQPAQRVVTYGSAEFRIGPGKQAVAKVKLNPTGKRLMRNQGQPKVWVNVQMKGQTVEPRRITLKPAPREPGR